MKATERCRAHPEEEQWGGCLECATCTSCGWYLPDGDHEADCSNCGRREAG